MKTWIENVDYKIKHFSNSLSKISNAYSSITNFFEFTDILLNKSVSSYISSILLTHKSKLLFSRNIIFSLSL